MRSQKVPRAKSGRPQMLQPPASWSKSCMTSLHLQSQAAMTFPDGLADAGEGHSRLASAGEGIIDCDQGHSRFGKHKQERF